MFASFNLAVQWRNWQEKDFQSIPVEVAGLPLVDARGRAVAISVLWVSDMQGSNPCLHSINLAGIQDTYLPYSDMR